MTNNELLPGFVQVLEDKISQSNNDSTHNKPELLAGKSLEELNVKNAKHREIASDAIMSGEVVLIQLPTLGLMVDASKPDKVADAFAIKGTPRELRKTITLAIDDLDMITPLVAIDKLHHSVQKYFDRNDPHYTENKEELGRRIGGINIVRVPIYTNDFANSKINGVSLHSRIVSQGKDNQMWMQFLYFGSYNRSAQALVRTANDKVGITGLTSINSTGQETITDLDKAMLYANNRGVVTAITDPTVKGGLDTRIQSYPIIVFNKEGIEITRSENMNLDEKIVMALWNELFENVEVPDYLQNTPPPLWRYILSDTSNSDVVIQRFKAMSNSREEIAQMTVSGD